MPPPVSSTKALNAILPLIAAGQAYEAHQKARTFASRYVKAQQHDVAIDVLYQSAKEMFKASQAGSGTDLGTFLLEVYETKGEVVGDESRARLTQLIALAGPEGQWRKTLIEKSLLWSSKHSPYEAGDPFLNGYIGSLLYKESDFQGAEPHLLASGSRDSARLLADMLFQWSRSGADPGTYASRGTIPFLLTGNILAARTFLSHFTTLVTQARPDLLAGTATVGEEEVPMSNDLVLNFLQLAVRLCQRGYGSSSGDGSPEFTRRKKEAQEAWVKLCGSYQSRKTILATSAYREALSEIGSVFFDLPIPRLANQNPLGDLMASLMGGGAPSGPPKRRGLPLPSAAEVLD